MKTTFWDVPYRLTFNLIYTWGVQTRSSLKNVNSLTDCLETRTGPLNDKNQYNLLRIKHNEIIV